MTEKLNVFAVRTLTQREYFAPGHRACQGCAEALAVRLVAKALGRNVVVASATGCMEIVSSPFPFTSWRGPWFSVISFCDDFPVLYDNRTHHGIRTRRSPGPGGEHNCPIHKKNVIHGLK